MTRDCANITHPPPYNQKSHKLCRGRACSSRKQTYTANISPRSSLRRIASNPGAKRPCEARRASMAVTCSDLAAHHVCTPRVLILRLCTRNNCFARGKLLVIVRRSRRHSALLHSSVLLRSRRVAASRLRKTSRTACAQDDRRKLCMRINRMQLLTKNAQTRRGRRLDVPIINAYRHTMRL